MTAHDLRPPKSQPISDKLFYVQGDISDEQSIADSFCAAQDKFGPINILCANAGITNEQSHPSIWELPLETWENVYRVNTRGTFLTIKHFLLAAKEHQDQSGQELANLAIVVTGSECGKFGQAGHAEYASGKAGLQYGLVPTVKNEIVRLNALARINAVAPGWVNTDLIGDRLDDPTELYYESQGTVPLRKIARPQDVAKCAAFLASHAASGHMSGQCLSVDGGMEGRIMWRPEEILEDKRYAGVKTQESAAAFSIPQQVLESGAASSVQQVSTPATASTVPQQVSSPATRKTIKIAWSVDFDAVSGWLGTGKHPDNNTNDISAGYMSGIVGVPRLLRLFKKLGLSDRVTWCLPGHSMETFPVQTKAIIASGCEVALHGYAHESAAQMTPEQERDVLEKCIKLVEKATGKRPRGYRAPLYQLKERTIALLQENGFLWDSSLSHHETTPYFLPQDLPSVPAIDFSPSAKASDWMKPAPNFESLPKSSLVEIPANWYMEDATPLQFYPHTVNSQGYVDARVMERMWKDRFEWMRSELADGSDEEFIFSMILHPDTSGMAHIIGMIERFLRYLQSFGDEVEFLTYTEIAEDFKSRQQAA